MIDKKKGFSFGLGRAVMQKVDHDRDQEYLIENPGPGSHVPIYPGRELAKDSVKYSMAHKIHFQESK